MKKLVFIIGSILLLGYTGQAQDDDWYEYTGSGTSGAPNNINDDVVTNGVVGIGCIDGSSANIEAVLHVVNDQIRYSPGTGTNNFSRFGVGSILENPTLVVVASNSDPGSDPRIAEFRSSRAAQQDAAVNIRGSRNGSTTAQIAQLLLSNYDLDDPTEFTMARVSAGMPINSGERGFLALATNDGNGLQNNFYMDHEGNVGIGDIFASASLPSVKLDVDGLLRVRDLPTNTTGSSTDPVVVDSDGNLYADPNFSAGADDDWYEQGTSSAPNGITDDIFTEGEVRIGDHSGDPGFLEVEADGGNGAYIYNTSSSTTTMYGMITRADNTTSNSSARAVGLYGDGRNADDINEGVRGLGFGGDQNYGGYFIAGEVNDETQSNFGVYATALGTEEASRYAVYAQINNNGNTNPDAAVYADGDILYTTQVMSVSDRKFKSNFDSFNAMSILEELNPVQYEFKEFDGINLPKGLQYGFIADEYKQVLPQCVEEFTHPESEDNAEINYEAISTPILIPVLVKAVKDQQAEISALKERVEEIENQISNTNGVGQSSLQSSGLSIRDFNAYPNPTSAQLNIAYDLGNFEQAISPKIVISDLQGKFVTDVRTLNNAEGEVSFNLSNLANGIYLYNIISEGEILASKRVVVKK